MHRSDAQRADAQPLDGVRFDGRFHRRALSPLVETPREQQDDALGAQTTQREHQHACRRGVDPLGVVDREDERPLLGKHLEARPNCDPERTRVERRIPAPD